MRTRNNTSGPTQLACPAHFPPSLHTCANAQTPARHPRKGARAHTNTYTISVPTCIAQTEGALLAYLRLLRYDYRELRANADVVKTFAFSSARRAEPPGARHLRNRACFLATPPPFLHRALLVLLVLLLKLIVLLLSLLFVMFLPPNPSPSPLLWPWPWHFPFLLLLLLLFLLLWFTTHSRTDPPLLCSW